jgi:hypothetical protein
VKKTLSLCLIILALSSCKISQQKNKDADPGLGGQTAPTARTYTASELEIARRICSNLKKKRDFFETLNNEKEQFRFRAELRNCNNDLYNNDLFVASISNANSTDLEYIVQRENYLKDIVTDQSGLMKQMCDDVVKSDSVSNTAFNGNFKYSLNFLIADGYDRFDIYKAKKLSDGSYQPLSVEFISVISQKIQAPTKFFGVEKERIRITACDGKKFSTIKQTWVEAVTNF